MRVRILEKPGIIVALACTLAVVGVLIYGYATRPGWVGVADKKLWDYLDLLIVPAALAIGIFWLNSTQSKRESELEDQRREREQLTTQTLARDSALQAYLDQMGHLLLDQNLRASRPGDDARLLARARTLAVLGGLVILTGFTEPFHKRSVVEFLYNAKLITKDQSIVSMSNANLIMANLDVCELREADLSGALLANSTLKRANLLGADLRGADLSNAKLMEANLAGANLKDANLKGADLTGAILKDAIMPDGSRHP